MRQHLTGMDNIGAINKTKRFTDIVVRDEHADATAGQVTHELLDVRHRNRVNTSERFVEQHEIRT